jgi:hypothetical protein
MSDNPKCEKCGVECTTGMQAAFCQYARECVFWPHSEGKDAVSEGAELFMAKAWMDNACRQIGLQIDARGRLELDVERLLVDSEAAFACITALKDDRAKLVAALKDQLALWTAPYKLEPLRQAAALVERYGDAGA